jgi:hypothetical protein
MEFDIAMTAAYAKVDKGLVDISGGGFDSLTVKEFPYRHASLYIVMKVSLSPQEQGKPHKIEVRPFEPSGKKLVDPLLMEFNVDGQGSRNSYALAVATLNNLIFPDPGTYRFDLLLNGIVRRSLYLTLNKDGQ